MAEQATVSKTIPAHTVTRTNINWGQVLKGVAIVAAVVVVGAVAYSAAAGFLASPAGVPVVQFFGGVAEFVMGTIVPALQTAFSFVAGGIADLFGIALPNVAEASWVAGAVQAPAVANGLALGAGVAAAGAGVMVTGAHHHLADTVHHLSVQETVNMPAQTIHQQVDVPSQIVTQGSAPGVEGHNLGGQHGAELAAKNSELASHASNHPDEAVAASSSRSQQQRSQTWAERAPQQPRRDITPRHASHSEQIQSEQSHSALAEAAR